MNYLLTGLSGRWCLMFGLKARDLMSNHQTQKTRTFRHRTLIWIPKLDELMTL